MRAYEIPETRWAFKLATQLTGKAQQAYAALPAESASSYQELKAAILRRYDISEETYRQRFRTTTKEPHESYRELVVRLQDLQERWTKKCTSVDELREVYVMEQFLNTLPADLRLWIREQNPKAVADAAELADQFAQAHKQSQEERWGTANRREDLSTRRCSQSVLLVWKFLTWGRRRAVANPITKN